jgi:uncharacterized protein (DUF697 family)/tellurite resistance protein
METSGQRAILTICLMAAVADGQSDDRERAKLREITQALGADAGGDLSAVYEDVLLKKSDLATVAAALTSPEARQQAYEAAVGVCNADGVTSPAEQAFLAQLAAALGIAAAPAAEVARAGNDLASAPLGGAAPAGTLVGATAADPAALDASILNYAILNGALELLPQSLASMAIIPLQMKMVYGIGKAYGFELDRGHVKDLLATLGVGLTSQYVEQFGRRLVGGLLGSIGGGLLRGMGSVTTGAAFSFATTYALGQVAKRYYGGGRTIDAAGLQQAFATMLGDAKQMQGKYAGQIAEQARTLDVNKLLTTLKQ